jgi:hypothetical protein
MSVQCSGRGGFARGGGHKFEPQQPRSVATLREKHVTCDGDEWVAGWWGHPPALWFRGSGGHPPAKIVISTGIRLPAGVAPASTNRFWPSVPECFRAFPSAFDTGGSMWQP